MDRYNIFIPKSQAGFVNIFIKPCFESLVNFLPKARRNLENLEFNVKKWEDMADEWTKGQKDRLEGGA